mgnify:CR=1 FL=1
MEVFCYWLLSSCSHCVLISALTSALSPTPLDITHITHHFNRYTGSNGGLIGTRIAMYPFLLEILERLEGAALAENHGREIDVMIQDRLDRGETAEPGEGEDLMELKGGDIFGSGVKLSVFSGHDTVIAPVLAALGVYDDHCEWPPYASRIAFELYEKEVSSHEHEEDRDKGK